MPLPPPLPSERGFSRMQPRESLEAEFRTADGLGRGPVKGEEEDPDQTDQTLDPRREGKVSFCVLLEGPGQGGHMP